MMLRATLRGLTRKPRIGSPSPDLGPSLLLHLYRLWNRLRITLARVLLVRPLLRCSLPFGLIKPRVFELHFVAIALNIFDINGVATRRLRNSRYLRRSVFGGTITQMIVQLHKTC